MAVGTPSSMSKSKGSRGKAHRSIGVGSHGMLTHMDPAQPEIRDLGMENIAVALGLAEQTVVAVQVEVQDVHEV
jgi:hypothetical protein